MILCTGEKAFYYCSIKINIIYLHHLKQRYLTAKALIQKVTYSVTKR